MVSKNNIVNHLKFKSDNKQRFTIKKFAVGAASVLIGTTLYVGSGSVSADEVNSASGDNVAEVVTSLDDVSDDKTEDVKSSETDDVVDDATTVEKDSNVVEEVAPVQNATNAETTEFNTESVEAVDVNQDNTVNDVTKSDDVVESDKVDTDNNSNDAVNSTDVVNNANTISNNNSVLRSADKADQTQKSDIALDDGTKLTFDKPAFEGNLKDQINGTFTSAGFKAGDVYDILVPSEYVESVLFAGLPAGLGTTTQSKEAIDGKEYFKITNNFISEGNINQKIILNRALLKGSGDKLYPGQVLGIDIIFRKNGIDMDEATLNYVLPKDLQGSTKGYDPNYGTDVNLSKFNNVDYLYAVGFSGVLRNVDDNKSVIGYYLSWDALNRTVYHVQVKVGVPEYFELNKDKDVYLGDSNVNLGKATQDGIGQDIVIDIPIDKLSRYQNYIGKPGWSLVFSGAMRVPDKIIDSATSVLEFKPSHKSSVEFTFNDGSTQSLPEFELSPVRVNNVRPGDATGDAISVISNDSSNYVEGDSTDYIGVNKPAYNTGDFILTNITDKVLNDVEVTYELPDGLTYKSLADKLMFSSGEDFEIYDVLAEYRDGSISNSLSNGTSVYLVNNDSYVKKLSFKIRSLNPGQQLKMDLNSFKISKTYQDGRLVKAGDVLQTKLIVNDSTFYQNDTIHDLPVANPSVNQSIKNLDGDGPFTPGNVATRLRGLWAYSNGGAEYEFNVNDPIVYLSLPESLMVDFDITSRSFSITVDNNRIDESKYTVEPVTVNGKSLIKISFNEPINVKRSLVVSLIKKPSIISDVTNLSDGYYAFLISDKDYSVEGSTHSRDTYIGSDQSNMDDYQKSVVNGLIEQGYNAGSIVTGPRTNYNVLVSEGTTSVDLTKGNLDLTISQNSNSDVFISDTFDVTHSLVNSSNVTVSNAYSFVNIPGTYDGVSQFDTELTGPITLIDVATGQVIDSGVTVKYSTDTVNVDKSNRPSADNYVDASQVTDWSKIKSYVIVFNKLDGNKSVRAIAPLKDKDAYNHAGKFIKTSSLSYADGLDTIAVKASDLASSKLTMKGSVTLHTQIKWTDNNGQEHVIKVPLDKTFDLSKNQTLNKSDFMTSAENQAYKSVMDQIPEDYIVDFDNPTIENSSDSYREGFANDVANFGDTVKYNANNDVVTYTLVPRTEEVTETKDVTRTINYLAKKDNSKLADPVVQKVTFTRKGTKDLVTNEITWDDWSSEQSFDSVKSPDVENYRPELATVAAQTVGHDSDNIEVTVPYVTKGSMTVDFIDDITGKVIGSFTHDGFGGDQFGDEAYIDFSNTYDRLINVEHYQTVDENTQNKFDEFANTGYVEDENRKFEVHLVHQLSKTPRITTRAITWDYKYKESGEHLPDVNDDSDITTYGSFKITDLVTGEVTWSPAVIDGYHDDGSFIGSGELVNDFVLGSKLKLPEKQGYSTYVAKKWLDVMEGKASDDETLVKIDEFPSFNLLLANKALSGPTMDDLVSDTAMWGPVTVWYVKDDQHINVRYVDNTTGEELYVDSMTGKSNESSDYTTKDKIDEYVNKGYKLVSDDTNGEPLVYDNDSNVDQEYVVKLQHNTEEVTDTKDVTRTIHYVAKSDPSKTLSPDVTQTLTFTRTGTKDLVTNEITWGEWSPEQSFDPVKSPDVENYRPESATVVAQMVGYDSNNIEVTVPYVTKGSMTVDFIDDITGKVVGSFTHDGFGGDQFGGEAYIDFSNTYDRLINVEHYQTVDDDVKYTFERFAETGYIENEDRKFEVHLVHQLDKRQMNTSRQLSWDYKYKDSGDDVADLDYDTIVYGSYKTTDLVTGEVTYSPIVIDGYDLNGSFLGSGEPLGDPVLGSNLKLPEKPGYSTYIAKKWLDAMEGKASDDETLVKIDDFPAFNLQLANKALVGPTIEDLLSVKIDDINWGPVTVWYVKDDQHINVKYVDDTTGKELHVDSMTGKSDESSGYTTKDKINEYLNKGYKLVSDDTNGETLVYDNDSNVDQEYVVHLVQDAEVVNESKLVNHTIHYVESPANTPIFDDVQQQLTFNREGSKNKVTGDITWNEWTPEQTFESVTSPVKKGYTADKLVVSGVVATHESNDLETYVFYVADNQHIKVTYIDDVTGAVLSVDNLDGSTGTSSDYSTQESIKKYESQGYKVVSDDTDGKVLEFDDNSDTDQEYVVHLTHATEQVSDSKSVNRVVHYVDQNDNKLFDDHVDKALTFDRTGSKDLVTGEITWAAWTPATQEFDLVVSPTKAGYTPSVKFVPSSEVTADSENIEETVVYVPNKQYVVVNYIDDTTGDILTTDSLNGVSEEALDYTTKPKIEDYVSLGYELVSDETNGQPIVLDSDDDATQIYNVHLKHGFDSLSDSKTVKRTVHYVDGDGNKLADDYVYPSKEFFRTGVKDKVTGDITWNEWSHVEPFNSITSPMITGYVPDFAQVDEFMPTPESGDTEFTVTYNKTEQKAQITFIDDTLGKVLTVQDANGKFGETIVFDQLDETLHEYLNGGYKVVSNDFNNQTYKADDSENNYVVHLTHGVDEVSEDKIITRTINYVDSDGNVLKDPVIQTTTLTRTGSKDLVTGEVTWNDWTTGSYELVKSPMIDGYNGPDILEVPNVEVTADDEDSVVNVTYKAVVEEVTPEPEQPERPQPAEPEIKPEVEPEVPETKVEQAPMALKVENVQQAATDSKVDNEKSDELPQMGDKDNTMPTLAGLSLVGMMLGTLGYRSKKKHD